MKKLLTIMAMALFAKGASAEKWTTGGVGARVMVSPSLTEWIVHNNRLSPARFVHSYDITKTFTHRNPNFAIDVGGFYAMGRAGTDNLSQVGMVLEFAPLNLHNFRAGLITRMGYINISPTRSGGELSEVSQPEHGFSAKFGIAVEIPVRGFNTDRAAHLPSIRAEIGTIGNTITSSVNTVASIGINWRMASIR